MALGSSIHRATINLSDVDRGIYTELQLTVARHPSETAERLVARLLAFAICYQDDLEFTKGICEGDTPDIWTRDLDGRITHWVEVGLPAPERITNACKKAGRVTLFLFGRHSRRWVQMHQGKLDMLDRLTMFELPEALLEAAVKDLQRSISWSITLTEGVIYLSTDNQSLDAELNRV